MGDFQWQPGNISHSQLNAAIREHAGRQWGHVTRPQLLGLGLGTGGIDWRLKNGALVARYPGVYALAPARVDPPALAAAAVLAGGPDAVLSHFSAAFLWGFVARWQPPPEITLTAGDRRPRGILTHRCPSLKRRDITPPTRGPGDQPGAHHPRHRAAPDRQAAHPPGQRRPPRRLPAPRQLHRHSGPQPLPPRHQAAHPRRRSLHQPHRSPFEDEFLAFVQRYGLPTPQINVIVHGREVDAYFPDAKLIVEADGWEFHNDRQAFEDDRERDAENLRHGLSTLRITKERIDATPGREAERLLEILRR